MLLPKNNKWKRFWLPAILLAEVLDVWTTYINVVCLNGREINLVVNWAIEKFGADAAILIFVPAYKGLAVLSLWLFLTLVPYSYKSTFKIFPVLRTMSWFKRYYVKYIRFVMNLSYFSAYAVLAVILSAVIFNLQGALRYIYKFS